VWTGSVKAAFVATASWEYRAVARGPSTERRLRAENDVGGFLREMQLNIPLVEKERNASGEDVVEAVHLSQQSFNLLSFPPRPMA
jgi:hypothetical protein